MREISSQTEAEDRHSKPEDPDAVGELFISHVTHPVDSCTAAELYSCLGQEGGSLLGHVVFGGDLLWLRIRGNWDWCRATFAILNSYNE